MPKRLILLAHPDDEMLCLPFLLDGDPESIETNFFLYLTLNSLPLKRKVETFKALEVLEKSLGSASLISLDVHVRDGFAWKDFKCQDLDELFFAVQELEIETILTFAYEGGHQDHDLVNVLGVILQERFGLKLTQFSGYRKHRLFPYFVVSSPMAKVCKIDFSRAKTSMLFLKLASIHRSQIRVWFLLAPSILLKLWIKSAFTAQSLETTSRVRDSKYLYELRRKADRKSVERAMANIIRFAREAV